VDLSNLGTAGLQPQRPGLIRSVDKESLHCLSYCTVIFCPPPATPCCIQVASAVAVASALDTVGIQVASLGARSPVLADTRTFGGVSPPLLDAGESKVFVGGLSFATSDFFVQFGAVKDAFVMTRNGVKWTRNGVEMDTKWG